MPHKNNRVNLNLGSSSLLLIFVVLSLVSFAVLSLSTALSDKNMTEKNLTRNIAYYEACSNAQSMLKEIDDVFFDIYSHSSDSSEYTDSCLTSSFSFDTTIISFDDKPSALSFTLPVGDYQSLYVVVTPTYASSNGKLYSIDSWQLITTSQPKIDFSIDVIK